MEIGELYSTSLVTVSAESSLRAAARRLIESGVGSAVVLQPRGIITERDFLRAVADGVDLDTTRVSGYMTRNPITATSTTNVVDAARIMKEGGFRHLLVVGPDRELSGVFSMRDLITKLLGIAPEGAVSWRISSVVES